MKLDAKTVSVLVMPPGKTDHITRDSDLPGFEYRLRLGAGGKMLRSWIVQYRRASATRRLLLGSAGVLGAEAARTAAKKALAKVASARTPGRSSRPARQGSAHPARSRRRLSRG